MRKRDELADPTSCLNRADDNELIFVLRGKDVTVPALIRTWCRDRIRLRKNHWDDPQILEAKNIARQMEEEQKRPRTLAEVFAEEEDEHQ